MKKLIVIADWAEDSMNRQEIISAVDGFLQDPDDMNINFVYSTPSTIHTAFLLSQVVENEERFGRPLETIIFVNTDPRVKTTVGVESAKGAEFILIKLKTGLWLCGPNAGYCFSFIKDKIEEVFHYEGLDKGSQFRSRDLYARVAAHLMDSMEDEMDLNEIQSNNIPVLEGHHIGHIDNHGNIKSTIKRSYFKGKFELGETVNVEINKLRKEAKFVSNLFGGNPGELVVYPGSSGSIDDPFLEISVWRHFTEDEPTTGLHAFKYPRPGMEIKISK